VSTASAPAPDEGAWAAGLSMAWRRLNCTGKSPRSRVATAGVLISSCVARRSPADRHLDVVVKEDDSLPIRGRSNRARLRFWCGVLALPTRYASQSCCPELGYGVIDSLAMSTAVTLAPISSPASPTCRSMLCRLHSATRGRSSFPASVTACVGHPVERAVSTTIARAMVGHLWYDGRLQ